MSSALINHERIDTDVKQYSTKIELVEGYSEDLSNATFRLLNEDHTIGNSLRYIIMKNLNEFVCTCTAMSKDVKKQKKESILDLNKYVNTEINVQFQGGRHATGTLKGFDQLMNLVMDGVVEFLPDSNKRTLGLVVLRGPSITVLNPSQGHEQIPNPFV
ncbi:hypothetical protein E3P99_02727 [Wallemia hederae]|uniref:Sm domain-containing protein n=1 Tax=Wallemia hederae TaxID=1540922 RepID=A0A4T0FKI1_9BASI|nr:hypothetical protein E3P99_02727 [Wallemia hederae]